MSEWFQCTVKYEKTSDDGKQQKVTEPYLVDAISFTEAERRVTEEVTPFMTGIFEVSDIKKARYAEVIESADEAADRFFRAKVSFITLDEKSGKEKRTNQQMLVQAADLRDSIARLDDAMNGTMLDYVLTAMQETPIMDVLRYQEHAPEGMKKVEKPAADA